MGHHLTFESCYHQKNMYLFCFYSTLDITIRPAAKQVERSVTASPAFLASNSPLHLLAPFGVCPDSVPITHS